MMAGIEHWESYECNKPGLWQIDNIMYKKRITEKVETEAVVQRVMVEKWEYDDEECGYVFGHQVSAGVQRRETHSFTGDNMLIECGFE